MPWSTFSRAPAAPQYVWQNVLQRGCLYAGIAPPGFGKTAAAISIALHIGAGVALHGLDVVRSRVLFLCGENPADVRLRAIATCAVLGLPASDLDDWVYFTQRPFAIDDSAALAAFVAEAAPLGPFGLLVIDTGPAHSRADDENDNRAMHELAMAMRDLMTPLGNPATLALMHPAKGATRDSLAPRGGSAFSGSIDGEIGCWQDPPGTVEFFHRAKFRGPGFAPMFFKLHRHTFPDLVDNFGSPAVTVVAVPIAGARRTPVHKLTGAKRVAVNALHECYDGAAQLVPPTLLRALGADAPDRVVSEADWRTGCIALGISDGTDDAKNKAFRRARRELLDLGIVATRDDFYWLPAWVGGSLAVGDDE